MAKPQAICLAIDKKMIEGESVVNGNDSFLLILNHDHAALLVQDILEGMIKCFNDRSAKEMLDALDKSQNELKNKIAESN